jgi:hypothetical protein
VGKNKHLGVAAKNERKKYKDSGIRYKIETVLSVNLQKHSGYYMYHLL